MPDSIVQKKSYIFALKIVKLSMFLKGDKHYEIASQLLRSGTSIGANVEEALASPTLKDFFAKMAIASKEARETNYWLRLLRDSAICSEDNFGQLIKDSEELVKILASIVKTGREKLSKTKI